MIFCMKRNIKVSYKLVVLLLQVVARYAQSYICNIFAIPPKKKEGMELIFLHADKHQTNLLIDPFTLSGPDQACPNYPE